MNGEQIRRSGADSPTAVLDVVAPTPLHSHHFFERFPERSLGSLHGEPCTVHDYLQISSEYGPYDLVEVVLFARWMSNNGLVRLQHKLIRRFNERLRAHPSLEIFVARIGATVRLRSRTIRIPDFAIGKRDPQGQLSN
eukprot:IDg2460t1